MTDRLFVRRLFFHPFWFHLLLVLCMAGAIWLTYKDCLPARFQLDDGLRIADNPHVHMKEFSFKRWVTEPFKDQAKRRWFAMMTISLNYYFAWLKPYSYRLVNVIIHMGSALLLYLLLIQTFSIARDGSKEKDKTFIAMTAFFSVMIWALHPLQTSAVTYIIQRMTSLSGMLYLGALLLYVHGRRRIALKRWLCYSACFFLTILAVGSKEPAIMIIATIPLYEFYFFREMRFCIDPIKNQRVIYVFLAGAVLVFALVLWRGNLFVTLMGLSYERYDFDMYQRLLTAPRVFVYYLSLIFWPRPYRICVDPSFMEHSSSLFHPWTTLPAFIFLVLYLSAAYFLRKKQKFLSFAMFWLLINLLMEQTFIPLQLLFHHRLYIPTTFFIAGLVFALSDAARRRKLVSPALLVGSAAVALLASSSYLRNDVWNTPQKIWEAEYNLDPNSYRIMINLSKEYLDGGQNHKALPILYKAIELNPQGPGAYINLSNAFAGLGQYEKSIFYLNQAIRTIKVWPERDAETVMLSFATSSERLKKYDEAETYYMKAMEYSKERKYLIFYKLGYLSYWRGKLDDAILWAEKAVAEQEKFYQGQFLLGSLYAEKRDYVKAEKCFVKSLGGEPEISADAYKHLGSLAEREGKQDKAILYYQKALAILPKDGNSFLNLGTIYAKKGDMEKAKHYYQQCIKTGDLNWLYRAYSNLGKIAIDERDGRQALQFLQTAYNLNSGDPGTLYMLGNLYVEIGKYQEGKRHLEELLRTKPDHPMADLVKSRIALAEQQLKAKKEIGTGAGSELEDRASPE